MVCSGQHSGVLVQANSKADACDRDVLFRFRTVSILHNYNMRSDSVASKPVSRRYVTNCNFSK